jgi:WD40 repeat protein
VIEHKSPISGIAAHDGRLVATAGYDNQIILWDHERRVALGRGTHDHLANQLAFSRDGRYLVSSSSDHTARLWSVPDMKLLAVMPDHADDVEMSVFHPFESFVATASRDHHLCVYEFTGKLVRRFSGHAADVISVCWSQDGRELISSSDDGTVKRWSFHEGSLVHDHDLGGVETDTVAIAADGVIFAGNDDGDVVVLRDGRSERYRLHAAGIKRLVLNEPQQLLVSLSYDRTLRVSSTASGTLVPRAEAAIPAEVWPRSCAFLEAGTLVFGTFGTSYALYDIGSDTWDLSAVRPTSGVNAVALRAGRRLTIGDSGILEIDGEEHGCLGSLCNFLTPAGERVFTGGQLGVVFDAISCERLHQHRSPINCGASFEHDGVAHVILGTYTGEGLVFSVASSGAVALVATLSLHQNAVKGVAVSGDVIFAVCADCSASWFSASSFAELARVQVAHDRIANGCASLPGGRFASISRDHKLRLWNGAEAVVIDTPHTHSIKCVAASSDGRFIATGSYYGVIAVYDTATSSWVNCCRVAAAGISSLCFDEQAQRFLAGSYDGDVHEIGTRADVQR